MKIVINECYGGFEVSREFLDMYNIPYNMFCGFVYPKEEIKRTDERLIEFIEKYGTKKASGQCSELVIVDIPKGTLYRIDEYDGYESIEYKDEVDWCIAT